MIVYLLEIEGKMKQYPLKFSCILRILQIEEAWLFILYCVQAFSVFYFNKLFVTLNEISNSERKWRRKQCDMIKRNNEMIIVAWNTMSMWYEESVLKKVKGALMTVDIVERLISFCQEVMIKFLNANISVVLISLFYSLSVKCERKWWLEERRKRYWYSIIR